MYALNKLAHFLRKGKREREERFYRERKELREKERMLETYSLSLSLNKIECMLDREREGGEGFE
jgi:hypothetical protein